MEELESALGLGEESETELDHRELVDDAADDGP